MTIEISKGTTVRLEDGTAWKITDIVEGDDLVRGEKSETLEFPEYTSDVGLRVVYGNESRIFPRWQIEEVIDG